MDDTIAGISTSLGVGAISIIRISGKDAIEKVNNIFTGCDLTSVDTHTIHYGKIKNKNNEIIDEVLVSIMKSPRTFTMEDVVEINSHGGINSTNKVLETILEQEIRLAEPGEFTKRAFLNGRIDLTQAEAVMDLIESKTDKARVQALNQLEGNMSKLISTFRSTIKELLASIEVNIDYPEYNDIEVVTIEKVKDNLDKMKIKLEELINESRNGELIKEGIKTVIIGRPNVGKSSILNKLLDKDKAIVTDIEGTTRDVVEGSINIDGILLHLLDTAGIRETEDLVEKIGVEKSLSLIPEADLVLLVLNQAEKLTDSDLELLKTVDKNKTVIVLNKNDLEKKIEIDKLDSYIVVSTNTEDIEGIKELKIKIKELFHLEKLETIDQTYLTNTRQISLAKKALESLTEAEKGINDDLPLDIVTIDLKDAFDLLGEIIGETYTEEIIDHLFKNFCVGK